MSGAMQQLSGTQKRNALQMWEILQTEAGEPSKRTSHGACETPLKNLRFMIL